MEYFWATESEKQKADKIHQLIQTDKDVKSFIYKNMHYLRFRVPSFGIFNDGI